MLLTISTTYQPATDLGYLLHKHPARVQSFGLSFGAAHVFYPEAGVERCTAAVLLDVDPVELVRGARGAAERHRTAGHYVNDRPYVASSFISVAIAQVLGSALAGKSRERPKLAGRAIPLIARIAVLPCRGGEAFLRRLFEPLGYEVSVERHPLDPAFPAWGDSRYLTVELSGVLRLTDLLSHLYVLIPVLDDDKHYWVGDAEVDKLLRHGAGWLAEHPERETIASRYLKHKGWLTRDALLRLADEDVPDPDQVQIEQAAQEAEIEQPLRLHEQRLGAVVAVLKQHGAARVLDLGCGEGALIVRLIQEPELREITSLDVSSRALELARRRLDHVSAVRRERVNLLQGALTYRDPRLAGYDAAAIVEVIEHLDPPRLRAFARVVFEHARPRLVVLTTPNVEYNVRFAGLPAGRLRHRDHRFEWTRAEFQTWARDTAARFGYDVRFLPVGPEDPEVGPPTQLAVFTRRDRESNR